MFSFGSCLVKTTCQELNLTAFINVTGTVVKSKRGKVSADLARPGDEVLVARGGQGGVVYTFKILFKSVNVVIEL